MFAYLQSLPYQIFACESSSPPSPHHFTAGGQLQEGWEQGMSAPAVICENQDKFFTED